MNRAMISASFALAAMTANASVLAQAPHTFVSGTPARAAQINENFSALDTRITANENAISGMGTSSGGAVGLGFNLVDGNNNVIGPILDISSLAGSGVSVAGVIAELNLGGTDYEVLLSFTGDGRLTNVPMGIFFTTMNCTGNQYIVRSGEVIPFGLPWAADQSTGELYLSTNPADTMITSFESQLDAFTGSCFNFTQPAPSGSSVFLVTDTVDVSTAFPAPFTIEPQ